MIRCFLAIAAILIAVSPVQAQRRGGFGRAPEGDTAPPVPKSESEKRILATLNDAVRSGQLYANVPTADGRMLRIMAESINAKSVVEIGTSTGLSGLWLSMALDKTGGKLTTFEYDSGRAAIARANFKKAGVDRFVTIVEGDAHQTLARVKDPIDLVFIDADKEGYVDYLKKLLPLVRPGGVILAHNTGMVPAYMQAVTTSPDLETSLFTRGEGLGITLKKR